MSDAPWAAWTLLERELLVEGFHPRDGFARRGSGGYAGRGNLVAVLEAEIATLDPHFAPAYISRTFGFMVFDTLFAKDANGEIKPRMVQDWKVSTDGLTYTFTLRDGLKWHDGQPVTAR